MRELNNQEIEQVAGGDVAMTLATGWAGTVSGFAVGLVVGGPIGGIAGGIVGFTIGAAGSIAYGADSGGNPGRAGGGRYRRELLTTSS